MTTLPANPRYIVVYGHGERATAQLGAWLAQGAVDSRLVRGLWVHRPATREQSGTGGAA